MKWRSAKVFYGIDYETNKCKVYEIGDEVRLQYIWYGKRYDNVVTIKSVYPTKLKVHVRELGKVRTVNIYNILEVLD